MQSLRFVGGIILLEAGLLFTRWYDPNALDGIAIYCLWAFAGFGIAAGLIGLLRER